VLLWGEKTFCLHFYEVVLPFSGLLGKMNFKQRTDGYRLNTLLFGYLHTGQAKSCPYS
jgi:hypothetical protein